MLSGNRAYCPGISEKEIANKWEFGIIDKIIWQYFSHRKIRRLLLWQRSRVKTILWRKRKAWER